MKCAIHQPQFLPWLGYLHKINSVDVFVFLDNVQFKKNEFQNRNRIRAGDDARWITVPVSFKFGDALKDVMIADDSKWHRKMCSTIEQNYGKAPLFEAYGPDLIQLLSRPWSKLAELNRATVEWLMKCFGIQTNILVRSEMPDFNSEPIRHLPAPHRVGQAGGASAIRHGGSATQRLIDICRCIGADVYVSGAGGRDYLDSTRFESADIKLEFQNFLHPTYPQCYSHAGCDFISHLSAIDGLFNCGGGSEGRNRLNI